MKVLFINNYPMDTAWKRWKNKEYGGHHLWGVTHLAQYGIDVNILPHKQYLKLKEISKKIKVLGDLDQQIRILQEDEYDIVYSGHYFNTLSLAFLRSIGLFKKPIVAIVFQTFPKNPWNSMFMSFLVKGHDKLLCLSNVIRDQLKNEFNIPDEKLAVLYWGADLPFYEESKKVFPAEENKGSEPPFILSAGKSYRDYDTLVKGFSEINSNSQLKIYCTEDSAPTISDLPSNIIVKHKGRQPALTLTEALLEHEKAYAVAIPLAITAKTEYNQIGQTSLLDTMAMGKAVVMTRNRQLDIDIEKEGIGLCVEPGDVKGWQQAISYLLEHPDETKEMGNRGRRLCEQKYNLENFSSELAKNLKMVYSLKDKNSP